MKKLIKNNLKNISGWKTKRKLLLFAVDDYGNIRLHSKEARERLLQANVPLSGRFDYLDALDTKSDYEQLFDVLSSVKDKNGKHAVFTPYALSCNVNYDTVGAQENFYVPENIDITYQRLAAEYPQAFEGTYTLLKQGIDEGLIRPQFHGREHINLTLFDTLLQERNPFLLANLKNRSLAGLPGHSRYPGVGFNQAFAFWKKEETERHKEIISDGLKRFQKIYGYPSLTFTPPAQQLHPDLYHFVQEQGIMSVDKSRSTRRHIGEGIYEVERNKMKKQDGQKHITIVRNCVFEPCDSPIDWVNFTFRQVKAAFFWHKPAIVSSHRVNFCGHIDPENRKKGLDALQTLLKKIVKTWPEVEFMALDSLALEIAKNDK